MMAAKPKRTIRTERKTETGFLSQFSIEKILPAKHHIWAVVLVLIILFLIFLNPLYFGGKSFESGDIISSHSMESYVQKDRDGFSLWNPYIFTGMPAYAIGTEATWFNLIYMVYLFIRKIFAAPFAVEYAKWTFFLIMLGVTSFLLIRHLTKNTLVSLFGAVTSSFSTAIIVFLFIGHVTKLTSLCMYPLMFLLLLRLKEQVKLIDFLLLIITFQLLIQGFHLQIIFYTGFAAAIYFIYYFIRALVKKETLIRNNILKSAGVTLGAAAIAILIQADNFTQIYEYTPYSTRGTKGILEQQAGTAEQSESDYYAYHTNWSFSPGEVMTFVVPSFYGFGSSKYKGPLTNFEEVEVNTYFGQMPFVDVAMYMGVLVFFLGLFAVFTMWKEPYVQFLTILSGVSLLISFGSTFPVVFDILFYNMPYFDKFRVPSMILVLVQMSFPVLAAMGLWRIIQARESNDFKITKAVKYLFFAAGGIFILSLLLSSPIQDWFTERMNTLAQTKQNARDLTALSGYAAEMFSADLLFAFGFTTLLFGAAFMYLNRKLSADIFVIAAIILALIDLWRIDARGANYIENPDTSALFTEPGYVKFIKAQNDKEPFRILNLKQDRSLGSFNNNSNFNAFFLLEDFYGYSGIKPRAYQDIIDVTGPVNATLWRMLNVKYIITDQPVEFPGLTQVSSEQNSVVYSFGGFKSRVYFVDSVKQMGGLEILNAVKASSFDPEKVAFTEEQVDNIQPAGGSSSVNITNYEEDDLRADVNASGNNFLFFGNTYLPTGWKAYVDGSETKIYKTNHGYMGIVVPQGQHKVQFLYAPESFFISKYIALILSSLVLAGLLLVIVLKKY